MASIPPILVIGLGNDFRSDDRVGLLIARRIQAEKNPKIDVLAGVGDALELIDRWNEAELVIIVDCAVSGVQAGKSYRFDALVEPIPEALFSRYSTHAFSVVDALALAGALGKAPSRLIVYGIEAADCSPGTELTPAVAESAERVLEAIRGEISAALGGTGKSHE